MVCGNNWWMESTAVFKYCIVAGWEMEGMTLGCFSMLFGYRGRFYNYSF